jgi:hypothetical protein
MHERQGCLVNASKFNMRKRSKRQRSPSVYNPAAMVLVSGESGFGFCPHNPSRSRDSAANPDFDAAEKTHPGPIANTPETLPAEFENRRIPRQWVDGVLHLDYNRPPTGVPLIRWRQLINDCHKFLAAEENWAERAAVLGWDAFALFGCHRSRLLEHFGSAGLLWAINGGKLIELHRDWAVIERQQDKSQHVYHRRRQDEAHVTLPWIGLRAKNGPP